VVQITIAQLPASCLRCGCVDSFEFRRRKLSNGVWQVSGQCRECGRAHATHIRNSDHPDRAGYPLFDAELDDRWLTAHWAEISAEREAEPEARRSEYAAWLQTSPEWRELRRRALDRDHGLCTACLTAPAVDVHHKTYELGRLPPAYELASICRQCHKRLHAGWIDEQAEERLNEFLDDLAYRPR
jgi:hypothetical protein